MQSLKDTIAESLSYGDMIIENEENIINIGIYRDRMGKLVKILPSTDDYATTVNKLIANAPKSAIIWFVIPKIDKDMPTKKYVSKFLKEWNNPKIYAQKFAKTEFMDNEEVAKTILKTIF